MPFGDGINSRLVKWREKFLCLKEIIVVLRKFESPENSNRVSFEANVVVNHQLQIRAMSTFDKTHRVVAESCFCTPGVVGSVISNEDVNAVRTLSFEVFDVKR